MHEAEVQVKLRQENEVQVQWEHEVQVKPRSSWLISWLLRSLRRLRDGVPPTVVWTPMGQEANLETHRHGKMYTWTYIWDVS
ncbi:unnamed protein product [Merluccius merluccius]